MGAGGVEDTAEGGAGQPGAGLLGRPGRQPVEEGDPGDLGLDGLLEGEEVKEAAEGDGGGEVGGEGGDVGEGGRGESGLVEGGGPGAPVNEGAHAGGVGEPRGVVVCGEEGDLVLGELLGEGEPPEEGAGFDGGAGKGMERTPTFAGMWRAEASRRGGCCESRAMDRRGQASAAVNPSRWRSGDRAENGCAVVPVGSGAREGPTHGVPGGGSTVAGCGRRLWSGVGEGGGWVGEGGRGEGISRGKRSGPGGSGMQSEQCYRQWRKVRRRGGGGLAGLARVGAVAGRGVRREVVTVGGASGEGRGVAAPLRWRCPVRRVRGVGRGCSTNIGPELGPGVRWCVGVLGESCYRCPTTRR